MNNAEPKAPRTGTHHDGRGAVGIMAMTAAAATGDHHRHGNGDAEAHDSKRSHVPEVWSC